MRVKRAVTHVALVVALAGCVTPVAQHCPDCAVVDRLRPALPRLRPGTRRLFVLVPGALGYGWEWNGAVTALRRAPAVDFVVFWWDPWGSFARAADELEQVVEGALRTAPASVREVVVVAHSAAGIFAARAAGALRVPPGRRVHVATIGAPLAGMMGPPGSLDDPWRSPVLIGVMGTFRHYPAPADGVRVTEFVTSYPEDPVMQSRYGHQVAPAAIGPPGRTRVLLGHADHNLVVGNVVERLINEVDEESP
jgi:hypothetical protein